MLTLYLRTAAGVVSRDLTDRQAVDLAACLLSGATKRGGGWQGTEREFAVVEEHEELIAMARADAEAHECAVGDEQRSAAEALQGKML